MKPKKTVSLPNFRGGPLQLLMNHDHEVVLSGGCLAGESRIYNPLDESNHRIDWLCEHGIAPVVQTLYGPVQASVPFVKGRATLFEVTVGENKFKATAEHRVLTEDGFVCVGDLKQQRLLEYVVSRDPSTSESGRSIPISDARSFLKTTPDFQDDCRPCLCSCGEPLLPASGIWKASAPLQAGVLSQCQATTQKDAPGSKSKHSRHHQFAGHLSSGGYPLQICEGCISERFHVSQAIGAHAGHSFQPLGQFHSGSHFPLPSSGQVQSFAGRRLCETFRCPSCGQPDPASVTSGGLSQRQFQDFSRLSERGGFVQSSQQSRLFGLQSGDGIYSFCNYTVELKTAQVEKVGVEIFYDIHVPGVKHYFAHGTIHHNSDIGKTWAACVKSLILCTDPDRPNVHGCMVRKTFKSIRESGARTFNTITQGMGIKRFGGAQYTDKWVFPNGSELVCVTGDTIIETDTGKKPIKAIYKNFSSVKVLAYDTDKRLPCFKSVSACSRSKATWIYRITTAAGRVVEATGNHPFFTGRGWIEADRLSAGDSLVCVLRPTDNHRRFTGAEKLRSWAGKVFLFFGMHPKADHQGQGNNSAPVSLLREANGQPVAPVLLQTMPAKSKGGSGKKTKDGENACVPTMQPAVLSDQKKNSILQKVLRRLRTFSKNDEGKASKLGRRNDSKKRASRQQQDLQSSQAANRSTGRKLLPGLRQHDSAKRASSESKSCGQQVLESGDAVRALPYQAASGATFQAVGDSVALVERIRRECFVYNFTVEGTENYFANGILTHNCAGLDTPERLLGSEWDFVQVIQAEQLTENEWEIIASRCTGRGATVAYPQIFADCNPGGSKHWLRTRKSVTLLNSTHKDNPALYDAAGNATPEGVKRIGFLESTLTGVRRKRLLEGLWATAEGAVYANFDPTLHVVERRWQEMVRWYIAIDVGFTNPTVILLIGEDGDGRQHLFRMFYQTGIVVEAWASTAKEWCQNPLKAVGAIDYEKTVCELVACDEAAAEPIQVLKNLGLPVEGAKGRVETGIERIRNRLIFQADGKPRLTISPSCTDAINEFESYVYREGSDVPQKEHDHCSDAWRYLLEALGEQTSFDEKNIKGVHTGGQAQAAGIEQPRVFVPRTFTPTRGR